MTAKSPPCRARPIRKASNRQLGTDFDDFLREQGFYDEAQAIAVKRMLAFELGRGMVKVQLTKTTMAKRMGTTRVQLDRLLNPDNRQPLCSRWHARPAPRVSGRRFCSSRRECGATPRGGAMKAMTLEVRAPEEGMAGLVKAWRTG